MKNLSYAVRNSLVLLVVLLLFGGVAWGYIHFYQQPKLVKIEKELQEKRKELVKKEKIAGRYQTVLKTYREANAYFNNYDKALYQSNNEHAIFDFLADVNRGRAYNNFNFTFVDSATYPKYGVINMEISGTGYYRNVVNFVRAVELSEPLNKVRNMSITPIRQDNSYNYITYSFDLKSYYDRTKIIEERLLESEYVAFNSVENPFYPLIHGIMPNTSNKINISQSELIALSSGSVFLIDQNGIMHQLEIGEEVYLGYLSDINLQKRTATFILNVGGIIEKVTIGNKSKNNE